MPDQHGPLSAPLADLRRMLAREPATAVALAVFTAVLLACAAAPLIAPHNPYDLASVNLFDARTPPLTPNEFTGMVFLLGTDDQGRDILSTILYSGRLSLLIGMSAVLMAFFMGLVLGMAAGYLGGWTDAVIMRMADVQLSLPGFLIALLIVGLLSGFGMVNERTIMGVLIVSIALSEWVQFARVVRSSVIVQKNLEYVEAAKLTGLHPLAIMTRHLLANVVGSALVIAPVALAVAIQLEATLSFLGVGMPPTHPSLGTLINIGRDYLFSGETWITFYPAVSLIALVLSINYLGDRIRDALNPKLRWREEAT